MKNIIIIIKPINLDEKFKIMSIYLSLYNDCEELSDINSLKIRIFILSEKETNSIMDKFNSFYENFIEELKEESDNFFYLLKLNSGIRFLHKQKRLHI